MSEILNKAAETAASAIMRFKAKTAGRYYPGYHEDMRDAVKKAILAERASLSSELDRLRDENAKLEDWSKAWHRAVETMCVLIGINGSASPEEILDELQSRTAALSPDNSTQKKEGKI